MSDDLTTVYMYSRRQAIARIEELEKKVEELENIVNGVVKENQQRFNNLSRDEIIDWYRKKGESE